MRLIDADVLIERIKEEKEDNDAHCRLCMDATVDIIDAQLTVEAKPVVHGEWIEFDIDYGGIPTVGYQCSECGQSNGFLTDFCPSCGVDMRGGKNDSF